MMEKCVNLKDLFREDHSSLSAPHTSQDFVHSPMKVQQTHRRCDPNVLVLTCMQHIQLLLFTGTKTDFE